MDADSSDLDKCPVEQKEENPKRKKSWERGSISVAKAILHSIVWEGGSKVPKSDDFKVNQILCGINNN